MRFGKPALLVSCDAGKEARCVKESIDFLKMILEENKDLIEEILQKAEEDKKEEKDDVQKSEPASSSVSDLLKNELEELRASDAACNSDLNSPYKIMGFWAQGRRTGFAIIQMYVLLCIHFVFQLMMTLFLEMELNLILLNLFKRHFKKFGKRKVHLLDLPIE